MATDRLQQVLVLVLLGALAGCGSDGVVVKNSYMRGVDRFDDGDFHEAIREYHAALADDPQDHRIWYNLALCYHELFLKAEAADREALLRQALEAYDQAALMPTGAARARLARARLLWDAGQRDEALATLDGMVGDESIGAGAPAATLAAMQAASGRMDEAEREYRRALDLEPNYEPALAALAALLVDAGRDGEAEALLLPAMELHRYDLTLRVLHNRILERRAQSSSADQDWEAAKRGWEQAEAFAAGDWEIAAGLARCAARLHDPVRAVRYYWYALDNASDRGLEKRGYDAGAWRADVRRELLALYLHLPAATRAD
ncbi:MAG: tetratricopeptide repeat protein [Planctomycetes bacterium]|nr:tetratricopeptide repeat protein [Planctomycetota bacterium]